jgi:hypothetical protein
VAAEGGAAVSDYLDHDRSELGDAFLDETKAELAAVARARSWVTGKIVAVANFAGSDRATLDDGETVESVQLLNPSPSLALDVAPDDDE